MSQTNIQIKYPQIIEKRSFFWTNSGAALRQIDIIKTSVARKHATCKKFLFWLENQKR